MKAREAKRRRLRFSTAEIRKLIPSVCHSIAGRDRFSKLFFTTRISILCFLHKTGFIAVIKERVSPGVEASRNELGTRGLRSCQFVGRAVSGTVI